MRNHAEQLQRGNRLSPWHQGKEKVAIVGRSLGCQSPPLSKPGVMRAFQPHWDLPSIHLQIVGQKILISFNNEESKSENPYKYGLQGKGRRNREKVRQRMLMRKI